MPLGAAIIVAMLGLTPALPPASNDIQTANVSVRDRMRCHNHINCAHACRNQIRFGPRYRICLNQCERQNRLRPCNAVIVPRR